jgi:hypothetical protein
VTAHKAVGVEHCLDRHEYLDLDGDVAGGGLSGESFDENVGEDLAACAGDGVGGDVVVFHRPVQRTEAGGRLLGGQARNQVDPGVDGLRRARAVDVVPHVLA